MEPVGSPCEFPLPDLAQRKPLPIALASLWECYELGAGPDPLRQDNIQHGVDCVQP